MDLAQELITQAAPLLINSNLLVSSLPPVFPGCLLPYQPPFTLSPCTKSYTHASTHAVAASTYPIHSSTLCSGPSCHQVPELVLLPNPDILLNSHNSIGLDIGKCPLPECGFPLTSLARPPRSPLQDTLQGWALSPLLPLSTPTPT